MNTPLRAFRIPDDLYDAILAESAQTGESASVIVRRVLAGYVKTTQRKAAR